MSLNLPTFYVSKGIFEALPEGIFKKERYFYIVLFHDLLKSGVKTDNFSLWNFAILKGFAKLHLP